LLLLLNGSGYHNLLHNLLLLGLLLLLPIGQLNELLLRGLSSIVS